VLGTSSTSSCYIGGIKNNSLGEVNFKVLLIDTDTDQLLAEAPSNFTFFVNPVAATDQKGIKFVDEYQMALEIADATHPGCVTHDAQTIGGLKTFAVGVDLVATTPTAGYISQSGARLLHTYGTNNLCCGIGAGNVSMSGTGNTFVGRNAGLLNSVGSNCVYVGYGAGANNIPASGNCIAIGRNAATAVINENNFIEISDGTIGTTVGGDIRIGMSASTRCFLAGVDPAIASPTSMVVYDSSTRQLGSAQLSTVTANFTATLNVGSITGMTVRGASTTTIPITCTRVNNTVTMHLPSFSITAQTDAASIVNLSGAGLASQFFPLFQSSFPAQISNGGMAGQAATVIVSASGLVSLRLAAGAAFSLPTGPDNDIALTWIGA
jgi:hypothetical protein